MPISFFEIDDRGLSDYNETYYTQLDVVHQKKENEYYPDRLIMVEHPDVYTFGRKSKGEIPWNLKNAFAIERGGEATFHNPGQLVCYPLLTLKEKEKDAHLHLRRLEETIILVLKDFDISGERRQNATGVWIVGQQKKIASIGVAISSWITFHGSALNVSNDLAGFSKIDPCGFSATVMTSIKEQLGANCPSMEKVKTSFLSHFSKQFNRMSTEAAKGLAKKDSRRKETPLVE